ncbi:VWA domain-containing protein [soil metagenome]
MRVRYGRWSGTQDPFPARVGADDVLDEVAEDLLSGAAPDQALRDVLRRGLRGRVSGLDELRQRVEQARRRELARMGLEGPLRAVERALDEIVERERTAVDFHPDDEEAALHRDQLDALPGDVAGRLGALEGYAFVDRRAGQDFQRLLERLRRDVARATFGRLAGALGSQRPEDLARMGDLLADLNAMITRPDRGPSAGEGECDDFAAFKERYGDLLPGDPQSLDELLEELARRMAALSRLLAGMDPDQRAQLAELAEGMLGDLDLAFQADQLRRALQDAYPELGWDQGVQRGGAGFGQGEASLSSTVDWIQHLQSYDDLAESLGQSYPGARLEDIDEEALRQALGEDAARDLRALIQIERVLEEAGAATRRQGRLELTPRGIRHLGERSLARIYERAVTGAAGSHRTPGSGGDGELTGATRTLRFGDPFRLDVPRTVRNAILRRARGSRAAAVALGPEDFELAEAERRVRAATVLLLDMSFSMPLRGNWVPAKRVALALHALVSSKFPEDRFYVVGFSDYARRLQPRDLLATGWERVYGTNMQHAFMLARRLLGAHPGAERQVIMVTDGEPTAHLEGEHAFFAWPPEPRTLQLTLSEAARLASTGATLNVFLLDHDPGAAAFVERMVRSYGGRIFYPDLDDLGSLVVRDFLSGRRAS